MPNTTTIDNELLDRHAREIGPPAVTLYLVLRRLATERDGALVVAGYSQDDLALRMGCSRLNISRVLKTLKQQGLVEFPSKRGTKKEYAVLSPRR